MFKREWILYKQATRRCVFAWKYQVFCWRWKKACIQLEALWERRPPWLRQIITLILLLYIAHCKNVEPWLWKTTPPPPPPPKKKKVLDHYLHHDMGMLPLLQCFFAHLLILQYPDHHQNLISSSLYYSRPVHKFHPNPFITFWVMLSTDKQTDRQTNQRYQKHDLLCQGGNQLFSRYKSRVLLISF